MPLLNTADAVYLGASAVDKVYLGANEVWPGGYAAEVLADSPLSYWRLEETSGSTVADEQGARTGTVYGANLNVAGQIGSAASFDGVDDYIDVGDAPESMGAVTVEAIIKVALGAEGQIICADRENPRELRGFQFRVFAGKLDLIKIASGIVTATSATSVDDDAWHHVAGTYDGTNLRVYVDGSLDGTAAGTGAITGTSSPLRVGNSARAGGELFISGTVDEPAFYDYALSGARILAHAQSAGVA